MADRFQTSGASVSRRHLLAGTGAALGGLAAGIDGAMAGQPPHATKGNSMTASPLLAYVGCRTSRERNARGDGIRVYAIDPDGHRWTPIQLVGDLVNPSFLALNHRGEVLYAVHGDGSTVSSFALDARVGTLTRINTRPSGGTNPVHLAVDPTDRHLLIANYASGNVAVLTIQPDGGLAPVKAVVGLPGASGPHRVEQTSSHPHEVAFDPAGTFVVVPDKGLDRIFTFRFDGAAGVLTPQAEVKVREGAGPRHIVFAPGRPYAYAVDELDSTVAAYAWDGAAGHLRPMQVLSSLPATFTGDNRAAENVISPNGRFIFVSNRGHDSVATFTIDPASGSLTPVAWQATLGRGPRFITLDPGGRHLYAANELTDSIIQFSVDAIDGRLTPTGLSVQTGSPVCILFKAASPAG